MQFIALALAVSVVSADVFPLTSNCENPVTHVEWRELSKTQQLAYIEAVKCMRSVPSLLAGTKGFPANLPSALHEFVHVHGSASGTAHWSPSFLPWHRLFLAAHDHQYRTRCNYDGPFPYWDWSVDAEAPELSPIWDSTYGFGGDGDSNGCLQAPFEGFVQSDNTTCVNRQLNHRKDDGGKQLLGSLYSPVQLGVIMQQKTYDGFRSDLEGGPHGAIHNAIGGTMWSTVTACNDPLFFMHHRNVDRIWWNWQKANPSQANLMAGRDQRGRSLTGKSRLEMYGITENLRAEELFDTLSGKANGWMCFTYSNSVKPNVKESTKMQFSRKTVLTPGAFDRKELDNMRHVDPVPLENMMKMNMSEVDIAKVQILEAKTRDVTNKVNAMEGFMPVDRLRALKDAQKLGWSSKSDKDVKEEDEKITKVLDSAISPAWKQLML